MPQLLPSTFAEEAVSELAALVRGRAPAAPSDAYFRHDWSSVWRELATAGWTSAADGTEAGQDGAFSMLDLCHLVESWGRFLIPLPLSATLIARRWASERPPAETRLSFVAGEARVALVAHGENVSSVLGPDGLRERASLGPPTELDTWAPSAPVSVLAAQPIARAEARRDAALLLTSEAVGAAAAMLERTVDYVRAREQFGRPIGSFQAIKHKLANLHCDLELARAGVAWAAAESESLPAAAPAVLSSCITIAEQCVQLHGGIGYTWESGLHWYYRHVMGLRRVVVASIANP